MDKVIIKQDVKLALSTAAIGAIAVNARFVRNLILDLAHGEGPIRVDLHDAAR